jgi:hypothetical protein
MLLAKLVARALYRALCAGVVGGLLFVWLRRAGWPWWTALPAAILAAVVLFGALLWGLYEYTKAAYRRRAAALRRSQPRQRPEGCPSCAQPAQVAGTVSAPTSPPQPADGPAGSHDPRETPAP